MTMQEVDRELEFDPDKGDVNVPGLPDAVGDRCWLRIKSFRDPATGGAGPGGLVFNVMVTIMPFKRTRRLQVTASRAERPGRPRELKVEQVLAFDFMIGKMCRLTANEVNSWFLGEEYAIKRRDKDRFLVLLRECIAPSLENAEVRPDPFRDW